MLLKVEHIVRLEILPMHHSVQSPKFQHNSISTSRAVSSSDPEDLDNLPAPPDEILSDGGRWLLWIGCICHCATPVQCAIGQLDIITLCTGAVIKAMY